MRTVRAGLAPALAGLLFHDLRRTAIRNMNRAGIPDKVGMQISGHKTRAVYDRYNIVSEGDLDLAVQRMERHIEGLDTLADTPDNPKAHTELRPDFENAVKRTN